LKEHYQQKRGGKDMKKMMATAMAASMVLGLAGCGGSTGTETTAATATTTAGNTQTEAAAQGTGEVITLTFWDENAGDSRTEYYRTLIENFEAQNPNIKIEYLGLPSADALSKYQTAIQAGETPDIGGINNSWAATIVGQDVCIPLDEYYAKWDEKDDMNKGAMEVARNYHSDGKLYFMPTSSNFICLWVNTDMLKEAGLEGRPKTWDEFFTYCETLTDKDKDQYGYTIRGGAASPAIVVDFLYSYSGLSNMFDENGVCTINDPAHIEFANKYFDMYGKYTPESDITAGWKEIAANFDSGVCAMLTHNLGSYTNHVDAFSDTSKFAAYALPYSQQGTYINNGGTLTGLGVFKTCKNPEAAWKFVSFMSGAEGNSFWNQSIGQMPVNNAVLEYDWINEMPHIQTALETTNQDNCITYLQMSYLPGYGSINSTYIEPAIQSVMSGEMTAEELLNEWAGYLQEEYDNYHTSN